MNEMAVSMVADRIQKAFDSSMSIKHLAELHNWTSSLFFFFLFSIVYSLNLLHVENIERNE